MTRGRSPPPAAPLAADLDVATAFLETLTEELDGSLEPTAPNPFLNMSLHLLRCHLQGKLVTASTMVSASGVPYATATRKLAEMQRQGLIEQRPRSRSGRSFSLHPSEAMLAFWAQLSDRICRLGQQTFGGAGAAQAALIFFGVYMGPKGLIPRPPCCPSPGGACLAGLRCLVHGDRPSW